MELMELVCASALNSIWLCKDIQLISNRTYRPHSSRQSPTRFLRQQLPQVSHPLVYYLNKPPTHHRWLYTPRGCAVFYVPFKSQHLIRSSLPTSHGYTYLSPSSSFQPCPPLPTRKASNFTHLFEFVATIDYTPYLCIPAALAFRSNVCGGEDKIRSYCFALAKKGGAAVAEVLGTHVLSSPDPHMDEVYFTNVALPLRFSTFHTDKQEEEGGERERTFDVGKAGEIGAWLNRTAVKEYDTYLQIAFHSGYLWVRLSAQIYLELREFEWVAEKLEVLCKRVRDWEVVF